MADPESTQILDNKPATGDPVFLIQEKADRDNRIALCKPIMEKVKERGGSNLPVIRDEVLMGLAETRLAMLLGEARDMRVNDQDHSLKDSEIRVAEGVLAIYKANSDTRSLNETDYFTTRLAVELEVDKAATDIAAEELNRRYTDPRLTPDRVKHPREFARRQADLLEYTKMKKTSIYLQFQTFLQRGEYK